MSANWLADQISIATGYLTTDDAKEQVLPYLDTLGARVQVERHLQELCGNLPFIQTYLNKRFPPSTSRPQSGTSTPAPLPTLSTSSHPPLPSSKPAPQPDRRNPPAKDKNFPAITSPKPKKPKPNPRLPAPPPARTTLHQPTPPPSNSNLASKNGSFDDLAQAFGGNAGQVYMKNRGGEDEWAGAGGKKSRSGSGRNTPGAGGGGGGSESEQGLQAPRTGSASGSRSLGVQQASAVQTPKPLLPSLVPTANPHKQHQRSSGNAAASGSGNAQQDVQKSREVKKLERMIEGVKKVDEMSGEMGNMGEGIEGCFCLARLHPLSIYTPTCSHCGIILCHLQLPYLPCPSCSSPLLTPSGRTRVIHKLNDELGKVLAEEQREREREEERKRQEALDRMGGGSFPTLAGSLGIPLDGPSGAGGRRERPMERRNAPGERKVMTIGPAKGPMTAAEKLRGGQKRKGPVVVVTAGKDPRAALHAALTQPEPAAPKAKKEKPQKTPRPATLDSTTGTEAKKELSQRHEANEVWRQETGRRFGDKFGFEEGWEVIYEPITQEEKDDIRAMEEGADVGAGEMYDRGKVVVPGAESKQKKSKGKGKGKGKEKGEGEGGEGVRKETVGSLSSV